MEVMRLSAENKTMRTASTRRLGIAISLPHLYLSPNVPPSYLCVRELQGVWTWQAGQHRTPGDVPLASVGIAMAGLDRSEKLQV